MLSFTFDHFSNTAGHNIIRFTRNCLYLLNVSIKYIWIGYIYIYFFYIFILFVCVYGYVLLNKYSVMLRYSHKCHNSSSSAYFVEHIHQWIFILMWSIFVRFFFLLSITLSCWKWKSSACELTTNKQIK